MITVDVIDSKEARPLKYVFQIAPKVRHILINGASLAAINSTSGKKGSGGKSGRLRNIGAFAPHFAGEAQRLRTTRQRNAAVHFIHFENDFR